MSKKRKAPKKEMQLAEVRTSSRPQGFSGVKNFYSIEEDQNRLWNDPKKSAEMIRKMLTEDAHIYASIQAKINVILGTEFYFESEDEEIKELYEEMFFENPNFSFRKFLQQYYTAYTHGHSLHEMEFGLEGGRYTLRNLYFRPQKTLEEWKVKDGKLEYIVQKGYNGNTWQTAKLDRNLLLFTFDGEGSNFRGIGVCRRLYREFITKSDMRDTDFLIQDKSALGTILANSDGLSDTEKSELKDALQNIRTGDSNAIVANGIIDRVKQLVLNAGNTGLHESLSYSDVQISKGTQTMHLSQGSMGSGSRAVGEVQERNFYGEVDSLLAQGVDTLNRVLIRKLGELNGDVITLRYKSSKKTNAKEIIEIYKAAVDSGLIIPNTKDEKYFRELNGFPERDYPETEERENETDDPTEEISVNTNDTEDDQESEEVQMSEHIHTENCSHDVVKLAEIQEPVEKALSRVDFGAIETKANQVEERVREVEEDILSEIITILILMITQKGVKPSTIRTLDVRNSLRRDLISELENAYRDLFEFGKNQSANELGFAKPKTDKAIARRISQSTTLNVDKSIEDLLYVAKRNLLEDIDTVLPTDQIARKVEQALNKKKGSIVNAAVGSAFLWLGAGRDYTFGRYEDRIQAYVWESRLDQNVCAYCRSMHGTVTKSKTLRDQNPIHAHPNCRCVWVAIKTTDGNVNTVEDIGSEQREEFQKKLPTIEEEKDKFIFEEELAHFEKEFLIKLTNELGNKGDTQETN